MPAILVRHLKIAGLFALAAALLLLSTSVVPGIWMGNTSLDIHLHDTYFLTIADNGPEWALHTLLQWTASPWWFLLMAIVYLAFGRITGRSLNTRWGWLHFGGSLLAAILYWTPRLTAGSLSVIPGWHTVLYRHKMDWTEVLAGILMILALLALGFNVATRLRGKKRGA